MHKMAINKAELTLQDKLINDIEQLKQQMIMLKTNIQKVGADVLDIQSGNLVSATSATILAGNSVTMSITNSGITDKVLTIMNYEFTVYVDTKDLAHAYPSGSLTSAQRLLKLESWLDFITSDEGTDNHRTYIIRIVNQDTVSHVYFIDFKIITPKFSLA